MVLSDAEELLARIEGTDYVGIVPRGMVARYCENMFPEEWGSVVDFMHVYGEEMEKYGDCITWLPEEPAELLG